MANWIETKITYDKLQENGVSVKKTTESYLVDAMSFTEAEARIIEERTPYVTGEFSVQAVKKTKISEIVFDESADKFYLVKWSMISVDEKPAALGKPPVEKRIALLTLVQADDLEASIKSFKNAMKGTLADYEVNSVAETQILDIYPAKSENA